MWSRVTKVHLSAVEGARGKGAEPQSQGDNAIHERRIGISYPMRTTSAGTVFLNSGTR